MKRFPALPLCGALLAAAVCAVTELRAGDYVINGYTSAPASIYLTPPIIIQDPFFAVPTQTMVYAPAYVAPAPVVFAQPAYVQPVYAAPTYFAPAYVRTRGHVNRHEMEYKMKVYAPGRSSPVYSYKIDVERDGVKIRERYR